LEVYNSCQKCPETSGFVAVTYDHLVMQDTSGNSKHVDCPRTPRRTKMGLAPQRQLLLEIVA
jgi:hypothetical protein